MPAVKVDITQLDAALARFVSLAPAMLDKVLAQAAEDIVSRAQSSVRVRRGTIKKRIRAKKIPGGYRVSASAPHSHLIEYGHVLVKSGRVVGHVPAYPFFRPAVDSVLADLDFRLSSGLDFAGWQG